MKGRDSGRRNHEAPCMRTDCHDRDRSIQAACAPAPAPVAVSNTSAPAAAVPTAVPATKASTTAPQATTVPFPTKDITFIIPVSPGGGFDTNARILAPYLKKYLPGNPNVVPQNVPGGEWRLGIMQMLKSPPDGSTISIFNIPGNVLGQVTNTAEYDLNKVPWIGRITDTIYVMALSPKSKYKTLDDLKKATEVKSAVVDLTSSSAPAVMFAAQEMQFKVKMINYDGSTEAILSAVRGDVDMVIYPFPSLQKFVVGSTDLTPFVVFSKDRIKELPNTPTIVDSDQYTGRSRLGGGLLGRLSAGAKGQGGHGAGDFDGRLTLRGNYRLAHARRDCSAADRFCHADRSARVLYARPLGALPPRHCG